MSDATEPAAEDIEEGQELNRALKLGIGLGTPATFVVFFAILFVIADLGLERSIIVALWTALVGGAFYGGLAGMLHVLNRHGH